MTPQGGERGPGWGQQTSRAACSVIMQEGCRCVLYREKEGFNLLVLFIQKAPFCLLTDVSQLRPSISLHWLGAEEEERRRELQNIIILNGDAT